MISDSERQARRGAKRQAEIEVLRAVIIKAELARAQAENHLLRQRILDLETALAHRQSAAKSAQLQAASEVAHLKEKNKELRFRLRQMWDWYNDEITKAGGLTFKASSPGEAALGAPLKACAGDIKSLLDLNKTGFWSAPSTAFMVGGLPKNLLRPVAETLLNEAPLGVYLVDADFKIQAVNPTALPVFGDIPDLVGRDFDEIIRILWPKDYADEVIRLFRHTLETGEPYVTPEHIEERRDRKVREYYEWRINRIPLPEGRYGVVCYFRDISAYVRARQQRELLINELNHRVKNTLATVQSIAAQTLKGTTPAAVKGALESRLLSMAGAHDVLTQQNWEGADLRNIVEKALLPFKAPKREFDVNGPDIRLLPKSALAVAMAVHELATNAAKYGALSNGSGRISVHWAVAEHDAPHLQIVWTETGGPRVAAPRRRASVRGSSSGAWRVNWVVKQ